MGALRLLTAVALMSATSAACDEDDPATSQRCIEIRMRVIEGDYQRDKAAALGRDVSALDKARAQLISQNWECFR